MKELVLLNNQWRTTLSTPGLLTSHYVFDFSILFYD